MELSQEFLTDMALNGAGYLLAGIISILLYSLFQRKKPVQKIDEIIEETTTAPQPAIVNLQTESVEEKKLEFINFTTGNQMNISEQPENITDKKQEKSSGRMNRKEAINIAKTMLAAGATHDKIKKVLPVSEAELTLLSLNTN